MLLRHSSAAKYLGLLLTLLTLMVFQHIAQAKSVNISASTSPIIEKTTTVDEPHHLSDDDESIGFLIILMMCFLVFTFYLALFGILTAIALSVIVVLVSAGIMATSVIVGLYKRSISKGFKIFILLTFITVSLVFTMVVALLLNYYFWHLAYYKIVLLALWVGALSGWLTGLITFKLLKWFVRYCVQKFSIVLPSLQP